MAQVAMIAGLGVMCLSSSVGAALMMGGGEEDGGADGAGGADSAPDPDRVCPRTVTAKRLDAPGGWGMNLRFQCDDEEVTIGPGGANEVTSGAVSLAAGACPEEVNQTNWLGTDTYGDRFGITMSECLDAGETCPRTVTAKRLDASGGWGMNLRFQCDDEEVTIGPGGANEVTSPTPVNINKLSCPEEVNKTNWLGTDTYGDRFKITVSDCQ
jgi:hypothetical protein